MLENLEVPTAPGMDSGMGGQDQPAVSNEGFAADDFSSPAMQERAMQILEKWEQPSNEPAPEGQNQQPNQDQAPQPNQQQQQPLAEVPFEDASKNAFLAQDGNLDTQKISETIALDKTLYSGEESFVQEEPPKNEAIDPRAEYESEVKEIFDNFDAIVADLVQKGHDEANAVKMVRQHIAGLKYQYDQKAFMFEESKKIANQYRSELDQIREDKVKAQVLRNYTELSQPLEKLIPNVPGNKVLDQFVLNKKYGGEVLSMLFKKDNPNFASLPKEEQAKTQEKWLQSFQSNRAMFSMVAEVGRARWFMEQLPNIMQYAQTVGAQKAQNLRESKIGGPSANAGAGPQKGNGFSPSFNEFMGLDSVN